MRTIKARTLLPIIHSGWVVLSKHAMAIIWPMVAWSFMETMEEHLFIYQIVLLTTLHSYYQFDSIMVWAVDLESLTTSNTLSLGVSGNIMNLGQISTSADSVDEYIKCNINNEWFVFVPNFLDSLSAGSSNVLLVPTTYFYRQDGLIPHNSFYHSNLME